jgi:hypothetical protein
VQTLYRNVTIVIVIKKLRHGVFNHSPHGGLSVSGDNLIFTETPIHKLGTVTNQRIIINSYLAEGIPSEKITWRGADNKLYEFIFSENLKDGKNEVEYIISPYLVNTESRISIPGSFEYIVPLGWSRNGKFASIRVYTEFGGRDANVYEFSIFDAVTDNIVYNSQIIPIDEIDFNWNDFKVLEWRNEVNLFKERMFDHDIILSEANEQAHLLKFPLINNGSTFLCEFSILENHENGSNNQYKVNISRNDGSEKNCVKKSEFFFVSEGFISGYIKSPYEDRIVVIYGLKHNVKDWEGGPDTITEVISLRYTGSNLRVGF